MSKLSSRVCRFRFTFALAVFCIPLQLFAGPLPAPHWTGGTSVSTDDGYADLNWGVSGDASVSFFRLTERFGGETSTHFVDHPTTRLFRIEPGLYEFWVQACNRDIAGYPDCGEMSPRLELTVSDAVEDLKIKPPKGGKGRGNDDEEPGPGAFSPGRWHSQDRPGHGWTFYWSNGLSNHQSGTAWDLYGTWYTFEARLDDPNCTSDAPNVVCEFTYRPVYLIMLLTSVSSQTAEGSIMVRRAGHMDNIGAATVTFDEAGAATFDWNLNLQGAQSEGLDHIQILAGGDTDPFDNPTHYSGYWEGDDPTWFVSASLGQYSETVEVLFDDQNGNPSWVVAVSDDPEPGPTDLCFFYFESGYPPGGDGDLEIFDGNCDPSGEINANNRNGGREFTDFEEASFWAHMPLPGGTAPTEFKSNSQGGLVALEKGLNFHRIFYDSPAGAHCDASSDPGNCAIELTWFTEGNYPLTSAFWHETLSGQRDLIATDTLVESWDWTPPAPGEYQFELRMGNTPDSTLMAVSNTFTVFGDTDPPPVDPPPGDGDPETPPAPGEPPSITPTVASSQTGATRGEFSVTPSGSAAYRVPILVAPGSGGLSPSVSLVYDSQAPNGPVGVGWQIDGFSVISRCAQTVEQDADPVVQRITFTAQDRFCLDGQRLMAVDGAYGAHGTEYRKEIDDYTRVISYGSGGDGPQYFFAWSRDGVVAEFGKTSDSRIETRADGVENVAYAWAQNRVEDTAGNYLLFEYSEQSAGPVDFVLSKIRYTGNDGAGTVPYAELRFNYAQGREDSGLAYMSGVGAAHSRLLTRVDSLARETAGQSLEFLRAYHLEYGVDGWGRKVLEALEECRDATASVCFEPTDFAWQKSEHQVSANGPDASGLFTDDFQGLNLADTNGDGRTDLLITERDGSDFEFGIATGSPSGQFFMGGQRFDLPEGEDPQRPVALTVIDLNADGYQDVMYPRDSGIETDWFARLAGPTGLGGEFLVLENCCNTVSPEVVQVMDFDGDGLSDIMTSRPSQLYEEANEIVVLINDFEPGDSQPAFREPLLITTSLPDLFPPTTTTGWELSDELPAIGFQSGRSMPGRVEDFYGDGTADLLVRLSRNYKRCMFPPCAPERPEPPEPSEGLFIIGDHSDTGSGDGPGSPDPAEQFGKVTYYLVLFADENGEYSNYELIGLGAEAECDVPDLCNIYPELPEVKQTRPVDINADGLADAAFLDAEDQWYYRVNTGSTFGQAQLIGSLPKGIHEDLPKLVRLIDVNGDRYPELLYPSDVNQDQANWMVMYNHLGQGFSEAQSTNMPAGNALHSDFEIMLDFTSDGIMDLLVIDLRHDGAGAQSGSTRLRRGVNLLTGQTGQAANVITEIEDGFGALTSVEYKPLTDQTVHTRMNNSANADWGNGSVVYDLSVPYQVVSSVDRSAPTFTNPNQVVERSYYYVGAKIQAGGRGFLGFAEVVEWDAQNQLRTNTRYHQEFPLTGRVVDTSVFLSSQLYRHDYITDISIDKPITWPAVGATTSEPAHSLHDIISRYSIQEVEIVELEPGSGSVAVQSAAELSRAYTAQGQFKNKTLVTRSYDDWGNIVTGVERKFDTDGASPWSQITTGSQWINDVSQWRLGRLESTQVTHWRSGAGSITRRSSYGYHPQSDLLVRETAEPGHAQRQVITQYTLDAYGNRVATSVTGIGMPTRQTSASFDPLGRFAIESRNAYGQVVERIFEWDAFGTPLETSNIDSVTTTIGTDLMGRPFVSYTETGAWQKSIMGTGSHGQCPSATAYHSVTSRGGQASSVECFDRLGRKMRTATEGFLGTWVRTDAYFDRSGRPERVSEPYFAGDTRYWNVTEYDNLGRVDRMTSANGLIEETFYDQQASHCGESGSRSVLKQTNPGDGIIRDHWEHKNPAGETVRVLDDQCGEIQYEYDAAGNLVETIGIDGSVISIAYDPLGLHKVQMDDPDKGLWQYASNALGEVTRQLDSKAQAIDFEYDLMGRVIERRELTDVGSLGDTNVDVEHTETLSWQNSNAPGITGRGQVTSESYRQGVAGQILQQRAYDYDAFGRVNKVDHLLEGEPFTERTTYDAYGRVFQRFDASGDSRGVRFVYNARGYVSKIKEARDGADGVVYQQIQAMDARGNATAITLGNQAEVFAEYDQASGFINTLEAYEAGGQEMQFVQYAFDRLGNLQYRHDRSGASNLREDFEYDLLDRLERVLLTAPQHGLSEEETQAMAYDDSGNITFKSGVGSYTYGSGLAGPHAVTNAGGISYTYDANGNQVSSSDGRTIDYSVFDKPTLIRRGSNSTEFFYGLGNNRYKRVDNNAVDQQKTTWTIGSVELINEAMAEPYFKRYIGGIAIVDYHPASQQSSEWYLNKDHLGSIHSISNDDGQKVQQNHFGPWGARQGSDWQVPLSTPGLITANLYTTRGFTGHEHADGLGVIHMNGRIYDPRLGRFLQADPFVQAPKNGQSLNRYSYALNNPLSYTDPSGYFFKRLIRKWGRVIAAVIISYYLPGADGILATYFNVSNKLAQAAITGFVAGGITGGFRGAVKGAFIAAVTYGADQVFNQIGKDTVKLNLEKIEPSQAQLDRIFGPGVDPDSGIYRITVGSVGEFENVVSISGAGLRDSDIIITNGAVNDFADAVRNGTTHVAQFNGAATNYVLNFNQTAGLVADLAQSGGDIFGTYFGIGHTKLSKQLANALHAASESGVRGLTLIGHSQGGAITSSALRFAADNGLDLRAVASVQLHGAPINNAYAARRLSNRTATRITNRYQFADGVNAILGGNFLSNPLRLPFSLIRAPHLFSSDSTLSPHTTPCGSRIQLCQ